MGGRVPSICGAGGRGGGPKLIRSGKIWRMISHARAPDGGPADSRGLRHSADPLILPGFGGIGSLYLGVRLQIRFIQLFYLHPFYCTRETHI